MVKVPLGVTITATARVLQDHWNNGCTTATTAEADRKKLCILVRVESTHSIPFVPGTTTASLAFHLDSFRNNQWASVAPKLLWCNCPCAKTWICLVSPSKLILFSVDSATNGKNINRNDVIIVSKSTIHGSGQVCPLPRKSLDFGAAPFLGDSAIAHTRSVSKRQPPSCCSTILFPTAHDQLQRNNVGCDCLELQKQQLTTRRFFTSSRRTCGASRDSKIIALMKYNLFAGPSNE